MGNVLSTLIHSIMITTVVLSETKAEREALYADMTAKGTIIRGAARREAANKRRAMMENEEVMIEDVNVGIQRDSEKINEQNAAIHTNVGQLNNEETDRRILLTNEFADEHRRQLLELDDEGLDIAIDGYEKNAEAGRQELRRRNLLSDNVDEFVQFEVGVDGSAEAYADERGLLEMDSIGLNEYIFANEARAYQARVEKHRRLGDGDAVTGPDGAAGISGKLSPRKKRDAPRQLVPKWPLMDVANVNKLGPKAEIKFDVDVYDTFGDKIPAGTEMEVTGTSIPVLNVEIAHKARIINLDKQKPPTTYFFVKSA